MNQEKMNQENKICIVTGGGSGIGRATALALAREGHSVVVAGRRLERLEETVRMKSDAKGRLMAVATDVTQPASVRGLFESTIDEFGRLDVLFNNAGASTPSAPLEEMPMEQWKNLIDVNLTGVFMCIQEAFKVMKNQDPMGGRIINNGSLSAYVPRPEAIAYNATKHAVTGLTKSTSLEGRKYNIACGQIDIGNAQTDMSEATQTDGALQASGSKMVEGCFDVEHVGRAIVYMASLPLDANVQFMNVMATKMPFIGRG